MKIRQNMATAIAFILAAVMNYQASAEEFKKVGIAQFGRHPQLDIVVDAYKHELARENFVEGKNISYSLQQVNFDPSLVPQMVGQLLSEKPDLILTITTPVSQGAKAALQNTSIPAVFSAVSDPVQAKLVPGWNGGDRSMTGASDLQDLDAVMSFIRKLLPDAKRLGVPYNPGEDNDLAVLRIMKEHAAKHGFEIVEVGVETVNDVPMRIASFKGKADALYIMTSNLLQPSEPAIAAASQSIKMPVISGNSANVAAGLFLASFAVDYGNVGRNAAILSAKILNGQKPADLAVIRPTYEDHKATISARQLETLSLALPASLKDCGCVAN